MEMCRFAAVPNCLYEWRVVPGMWVRASSRICAASCIGLTLRPEVLACSARRVSSRSVVSLIGTLGWRTLAGVGAHAVQEITQGGCLPLQDLLARVALDDHGFVEEQSAAPGIIAPYAFALRERCGAAE